jgi:hypothetical protein
MLKWIEIELFQVFVLLWDIMREGRGSGSKWEPVRGKSKSFGEKLRG